MNRTELTKTGKVLIGINVVAYLLLIALDALTVGFMFGVGIASLCGYAFTRYNKVTALLTAVGFGFIGLLILFIANSINKPEGYRDEK